MHELLDKINSINDINRGGCGCSALAIYRYLRDRGIYTEIAYFYRWGYEYNSNSERIQTNQVLEVPAHIALKYHDFFIDSEGLKLLEDLTQRFLPNYTIVSEEQLTETLNLKPGTGVTGWNSTFNRENVRKLEEITRVPLTDVNIYDYLV